MANPATTADLVSRWRTLSAQETTNGTTFLTDAWRILKRRYNAMDDDADLDAEIATDADLSAEVVRVLATAVLRVMKNPDGKRQESIDDYSWQRDQAVSAGLLYISDDEFSDLIPEASGPGGAFMIDPLAGRDWDDWS
jgi:hypothetical protein